ncbi:MAG: hypothetical protein NC409_05640 [Clostridium sp.]|nr:hypothetical protein [Clostridium sp.]
MKKIFLSVMRNRMALLCRAALLCGVVLLCGCGKQETENAAQQEQQADAGDRQENGAEADGNENADAAPDGAGEDRADAETETGDHGQEDADGADAGESGAQEGSPAVPVALNDRELRFFSDLIREIGNYGFLLSSYDTPEDVNLGEVFYSGAGIAEEMSDEEIAVYLAACQQEELYTDCIKIPKQGADAFLRKKLGIGLEAFPETSTWTYLAEFDSFYHEVGDTNYVSYVCVEGIREGDLYTLRFHTDDLTWDDRLSDCETVILKDGENYQFVSNHYLADLDGGYGAGVGNFGDERAGGSEARAAELRAAYADALQRLMDELVLPDGALASEPIGFSDLSDNQFCVADVDADDVEELMIAWTETYVAGMLEAVYEYDPVTGEMRRELVEYPLITFFDNGMILAGCSHNQTHGPEFWPYNIYRYNMATDRYFCVGSVEGWQKEFWPDGFPDEADVSGTGTVYAIEYGEEYTGEYCYDQSQYDAFYEMIFGGADVMEFDWRPLTEQEVEALRTNP